MAAEIRIAVAVVITTVMAEEIRTAKNTAAVRLNDSGSQSDKITGAGTRTVMARYGLSSGHLSSSSVRPSNSSGSNKELFSSNSGRTSGTPDDSSNRISKHGASSKRR